MIIEEILSKISMKAPTLLLAIGIFILFWVGGIIFKAIVHRIMNEKSLHANISRVLGSIIKNIINKLLILIKNLVNQKKNLFILVMN